MKALLLKDLYELRTYKRSLILVLIMLVVLIIPQIKENDIISLATLMIIISTSMSTLSTFSYDEKNNTNRYLLTTSLTKKEIVLEKYLLSGTSIFLSSLIGIILSTFLVYLFNGNITNISDNISFISGSIVGISFLYAIEIPCIYKFGHEKGRIEIYIIVTFIIALMAILHFLFPDLNFNISIPEKLGNLIPLISILIALLLYFISYKISYKIYKEKEL